LVTIPDQGDGRPIVTLLGSEFTEDPASGKALLSRESVSVGNQVLVERYPVYSAPTIAASSTFSNGDDYGFTVPTVGSGADYDFALRSTDGAANELSAVQSDSSTVFWVPESALVPGVENWIWTKKHDATPQPYSNASVVVVNPTINEESSNVVRTIGVNRNGNDIVLRWTLFAENGMSTKIYFTRSDGSMALLTSQPLPSTQRSFTIASQALSSACGQFTLTQINANGHFETEPSATITLPPATKNQVLTPSCGEPTSPPAGTPVFVDEFQHRDHLGSLRLVTGAAGAVDERHDYYPFGREMFLPGASVSNRSNLFSASHREPEIDSDYMQMRFKSANYPFFSSPDPIDDVSLDSPRSWNKYAYVHGNPMRFTDPSGLLIPLWCGVEDIYCGGGGAALPDLFGGILPTGWGLATTDCGSETEISPECAGSFGAGGNRIPEGMDYYYSLMTPTVRDALALDATRFDRWTIGPVDNPSATTGDPCFWNYVGPPTPDCPPAKAPGSKFGWVRAPDYVQFTMNASIPWPWLNLVGGTVPFTLDRWGNLYVGGGPAGGKSPTVLAATLHIGWLRHQDTVPTSAQLINYLSATSYDVSGGFIAGAGWSWNGVGSGLHLGLTVPFQVGVSSSWSTVVDTGSGSRLW
jgi:RHS repeat-associated protein